VLKFLTLPHRPASIFRQASRSLLTAHPLEILVHYSLPGAGKDSGKNMAICHVCFSAQALHQLIWAKEIPAGPLPYSLCSVESSQELKSQVIFSGSCQGYFEWHVKDLGLLEMPGRQEPRGPCQGRRGSRQGACAEGRGSEVEHLAPLWAHYKMGDL
jgi:hypothetical protein